MDIKTFDDNIVKPVVIQLKIRGTFEKEKGGPLLLQNTELLYDDNNRPSVEAMGTLILAGLFRWVLEAPLQEEFKTNPRIANYLIAIQPRLKDIMKELQMVNPEASLKD
jgi:hypothetical protein